MFYKNIDGLCSSPENVWVDAGEVEDCPVDELITVLVLQSCIY